MKSASDWDMRSRGSKRPVGRRTPTDFWSIVGEADREVRVAAGGERGAKEETLDRRDERRTREVFILCIREEGGWTL